MGTTLLSIIGSLLVFFLGLLLYLVKSTRGDIEKLELHMEASLAEAKKQILDKVCRIDCIREMAEMKLDIKEVIKDVRTIERGK